jgi:hypothetical protein
MRQSVLALAVFVFLMIPSTSHAEWEKLSDKHSKIGIYYFSKSIKKHQGRIMYKTLLDFHKPRKGDLSMVIFWEADCENFRTRKLGVNIYKGPMATKSRGGSHIKDAPWENPSRSRSDSKLSSRPLSEIQITLACQMAN